MMLGVGGSFYVLLGIVDDSCWCIVAAAITVGGGAACSVVAGFAFISVSLYDSAVSEEVVGGGFFCL